jgi:lysophospholipase L1-like esterase
MKIVPFLLLSMMTASGLELKDGDRVALIGNTFIEREMRDGWIESMLTASMPEKGITYRNLGWSGDTVFGDARSYFGPPSEGLDRLDAHLVEVKPTVIVACYGAVAAFEGEAGLAKFIAGYGLWIDRVRKSSGGARMVLMSPPACETLGGNLPDMAEQNGRLAMVRDAIGKLAAEKDAEFLDLFGRMETMDLKGLTDNGLHYTEDGYRVIAGEVCELVGVKVREVPEGMRDLVKEKNRLFFYRWRPQNETYLNGFRKHEQGQNAREIPMFDPLIEAKEAEIAEVRKSLLKG